MAFTSLWANDNWPTSRATINTNFTTAQANLDTKVEFSWTAPAVGDMAVFDNVDGLWVKKKVFTASQTLESDSNGQPISVAKWTANNVNFGTSAWTALEWTNDALYAKLAGTQTITGDKTFTGALTIPSATIGTTQSPWDNSTKIATTAYADNIATPVAAKWQGSRTAGAGAGTVNIAHGLGKTPKMFEVFFSATSTSNNATTTGRGSCTSTSNETCTYSTVSTSTWISNQHASAIMYSENSSATQQWWVTVSAVDSTNVSLVFATPWAAPWTMYYDWIAWA